MKSVRVLHVSGIVIAAVCFLTPTTSEAVGYGAYFEYGHGTGHVEPVGGDIEFDENKYGFGFALDTNVAKNSLFNYRLNIGYQRKNRDFNWLFNTRFHMKGSNLIVKTRQILNCIKG